MSDKNKDRKKGYRLKDPKELYTRGINFFKKEDYLQALNDFETLIKSDPFNPSAWLMKGLVFSKLNRSRESFEAYHKAKLYCSDNVDIILEVGNNLEELGRYNEAVEIYDKILEINPYDGYVWGLKADIYEKLNLQDQALIAYDKVIEFNCWPGDAWAAKGDLLQSLGRFKDALDAYDKAIENDVSYWNPWYERACVFSQMGDKEKALQSLKEAIALLKGFKEDAKREPAFNWLKKDKSFKKIVG